MIENSHNPVGVYFDDLLVTRSSGEKINEFKRKMSIFEKSDLGLLSSYFGNSS